MWCNQIFSAIKKKVIINKTEEEYKALVDEYLKNNSEATEVEAQVYVLNELDTTVKYLVVNTFVCDNYSTANALAKKTYGEDAFAVDTTSYAVTVGNEYRDGFFYDANGDLIEPMPNNEEEIASLKEENKLLKEHLASLEDCILELTMEMGV